MDDSNLIFNVSPSPPPFGDNVTSVDNNGSAGNAVAGHDSSLELQPSSTAGPGKRRSKTPAPTPSSAGPDSRDSAIKKKSDKPTVGYFRNFQNAIRLNLHFIRHYADFYGYPITVTRDFQVVPNNSLKKRCYFGVVKLLMALRAIVDVCTFALSLMDQRFMNVNVAPFHLYIAIGGVFVFTVGYYALELRLNEFCILWNWIVKQGDVVQEVHPIHLVIFVFPPSLYIGLILSANTVLALNPNWPLQFRFLVYLAKSEGYLAAGSLAYIVLSVLFSFLDFLSLFALVGMAGTTFSQLLIFHEIWLASMEKYLRSQEGLIPKWRKLKELVCAVRIFNSGYGFVNFCFKILLMCVCLTGLSALFFLEFDNTLLMVIMIYTGIVAPPVYPLLYFRAPSVKDKVAEAKRQMMSNKYEGNSQHVTRQVWSIREEGVQIGHFQIFEREFPLVYWDFVVNQLVSIILTFKK